MDIQKIEELVKDAVNNADLSVDEIPSTDLYLDQITSLAAEKRHEGSPRFYDREFTVRGTKGLASQTQNMILLEEDHNLEECWESEKSVEKFLNCAKEYDDYLVDFWKGITDEQRALGHGGMDYFLLKAFFDAVKNGEEMPIDVYDAATWMAITPLSEQSVAMGGAPQPIPDFTRGAYIRRPLKDVVQLPNPSKNK
jgi:hypothetical protein